MTYVSASAASEIGGCRVFPPDNIWNAAVDTLPVDARSSDYIASIGAEDGLHPDFGSGTWEGEPIGIPYNVVAGSQAGVEVVFEYADESDPGPYPIPPGALIEGGPDSTGDRHVLVLDRDNCLLYELWSAYPLGDGSWRAGSGAVFSLNSNRLRAAGWTSSDAAGLPVLPGLVRYDEVASGEITHALRFTAPQTRMAYVWPARHYASDLTEPVYPPMGQRFRLRADYDISVFPEEVGIILQALKKYGMILADNGSPWFVCGVPDERWDNERLSYIKGVPGSAFEAVDCSGLMVDPDSGGVGRQAGPVPDIKINSSDGPVVVEMGSPITITVSLSAGSNTGSADWWAAVLAPGNTWYVFQYPGRWRGAADLAVFEPAYRGALFELPEFTLLAINSDSMAEGEYTAYFGVDLLPNGELDFDRLLYDRAGCFVSSP
jgi:hypothetical protein